MIHIRLGTKRSHVTTYSYTLFCLQAASGKENGSTGKVGEVGQSGVQAKVKLLNERATLFKITSNAMINACSEYLELTQTQGNSAGHFTIIVNHRLVGSL